MTSFSPRRRALAAIVCGLALIALTAGSVVTAADDRLPDLKMAQPYNPQIQRGADGRVKLRFGTIVWNVGNGPLDVRADEREGDIMRNLVQIVHTAGGGVRQHSLDNGFAFYAGDGHDHWHVNRFVVIALYPTFSVPATDDKGPTFSQRTLRKIGFCLTDLVRAPAALRPQGSANRAEFPVSGCGVRSSTSLRMGISVGYGDDYKPFFNQQTVDVTDLPAGIYRLCATVNRNGMWLERDPDKANNSAWVDIDLDPQAGRARLVAGGEEEDCRGAVEVLYGVGG